MLPVPTIPELALFTGRPESTFPPFALQALTQATLMFSVVTDLDVWPDDPDLMQLGINAILEMADHLLLSQPYSILAAGPYQSETIGSYSYSMLSASARLAVQGGKTGLFWWDIAVEALKILSQTDTAHGSIQTRYDGLCALPDGTLVMGDPAAGTDRPPYVRIS